MSYRCQKTFAHFSHIVTSAFKRQQNSLAMTELAITTSLHNAEIISTFWIGKTTLNLASGILPVFSYNNS
ncbi:hypothetical protein C0J52_12107 [Blattella germanica]|nr:hypothetical protein C0J52_12107 [Blattella germanica]